jgi:uncharacterized protein with PQ loop repeat
MTPEVTQIPAAAATLYGVGGALSVLLQARRMVARRSSCDVSLRFLATYVGGYAIWLLYGVTIQSAPIVLVHTLGLLTGAVTLAVALRLRGPLLNSAPADHGHPRIAPLTTQDSGPTRPGRVTAPPRSPTDSPPAKKRVRRSAA